MQPQSTEFSTIHNTIDTPESDNTSQYGSLPDQLSSADVRHNLSDERHISASSSRAPDAVEADSSDDAELHEEQFRRLNIGKDSKYARPKASFQRISEYESALSPSSSRKQYEGPGFKIIKKKGNRLDAPQLESFPNGILSNHISLLQDTI
jgi:hypothetical protein